MNQLSKNIAQYKHYMILIGALMLANYVVMPLSEWQTEQQQQLSLVSKKHSKVSNLLESEIELNNKLAEVDTALSNLKSFVFLAQNESKFKLNAQSKIEDTLNSADCKIERIGFKGDEIINSNLSRWAVELRFSGDGVCLTKTTRGLENLQPNVKIDDFNLNHKGLTEQASGQFNAVMNVSVWHYSGEGV